MRTALLLLLMTWSAICLAQPTGTSLKKLGNAGSKTWAVVVGISDYQDKDIPDLRFAHKDAEAFALWLQSPAGGNLDGDQLQVLINDKATAGRVAEALDALLERVQENDKVFIYFSGHGDVERKTFSQPGFLLCWDAPSRVYMGGGTYSLAYLQEIVTSLTLQNKAKVTVMADACRAGKLAGSQVGGPQLTSANLQRQQANELKILSCQPEEYSLEGTQWGGGRGVFSYHLMDGLYGLADRNADGVVTLGELDRYLEDHVTSQAAPISQVPVLLGNKTDGIALIHEETLADLNSIKSGEVFYLAVTDNRGLEDEVLAKLDSGIVKLYLAFKEAVIEKRFFPDTMSVNVEPTADELYTMLLAEPGLSPIFGAMTRNYAAALQDDAQTAINNYLRSDPIELKRRWNYNHNYQSYPKYLSRAAMLLGKDHYMYSVLKAREYYFKGLLHRLSGEKNKKPELYKIAQSLQNQAIEYDSSSSFAWNELGIIELRNENNAGSISFFEKALFYSPQWVMPYANLCKAYNELKQYQQAVSAGKQAVQMDSLLPLAHYNLGLSFYLMSDYKMSEYHYQQALKYEPDYPSAYFNLGLSYYRLGKYQNAESIWLNYLKYDSLDFSIFINLGEVALKQGRYEEAGKYLLHAIALEPNENSSYLSYAHLLYSWNRTSEAFDYIAMAIQKGATKEQLENDADLIKMNETLEWKALIKKHFPDERKGIKN